MESMGIKLKGLVVALAVSAVSLGGCASSPDSIQTAYISPIQYQDYDCEQVAAEFKRVSRKTNELHGNLKKTAEDDNAQMAIGMILFWPALFFLEGGDGPEAAEYARLKGAREALEEIAIKKKCDPSIIPQPEPPLKEAHVEDKQKMEGDVQLMPSMNQL